MSNIKVINKFAVLADITPAQSQNWEFLADDVIDYLENIVPDNLHNSNEFITACASLCFYKYIVIIAARGELDTMSTSDMSIKSNAEDKINYAKLLYFQSMNCLGVAVPDNDFYFGIM